MTVFRNEIKYRLLAVVLFFSVVVDVAMAQSVNYDKLSPMLRRLVRQEYGNRVNSRRSQQRQQPQPKTVCAFVRVEPDAVGLLSDNGCRVLAQVGDICIADIPLSQIGRLTLDRRIQRIEAQPSLHKTHGNSVQTDSLAWYLNALPVYAGEQLPQAYTGRGIVVGVMDIGFDLTHPNFYSRDTTEYRIQRFWDMLSADTVGSTLYVGRDYVGREQLLTVAHARDGLDQFHGTHTLGIAAGSGYQSDYRGMAPESDICLVANAVSDDIVYIDSIDYYKYTYATDALGFKYIFDYAESVGKPCVINFSEGSQQDFWGYDVLYYEMLQRLTGPGRIIVSAAGNNGYDKTWFRKQRGQLSAGSFVRSSDKQSAMLTLKGDAAFDLQLVAYGGGSNDTLIISTDLVLQQSDSVLAARMYTQSDSVDVLIEAYPSCYEPLEMCYDVTLTGTKSVGRQPKVSFEVIGADADVEVYRVAGNLVGDALNPLLNAGEMTHSILSPASSPGVICTGSTFYRDGIISYKGQWQAFRNGPAGGRQFNSSVGPTFDGRIKPDVMAPGLHVISSMSSYFIESHPESGSIDWDVEHFDFNGRTYGWNCDSGTSMASPAVAGAIALWLQAKPDMTTEQVLDVFKHTCRHFDESLPYPNNEYGYGEIDVYRGLLYLLEADRIEGVSTQPTRARVGISNGRLSIDLGRPVSGANVRLFSLSGRQILSVDLSACQAVHTISLPRQAKGVYVVQIDGPREVSGSTLVRF